MTRYKAPGEPYATTYFVRKSTLSLGRSGIRAPLLDLGDDKVNGLLDQDAVYYAYGVAHVIAKSGKFRITEDNLASNEKNRFLQLEDDRGVIFSIQVGEEE